MATHDYVIDNQTAPNFRSDLNNALQAIVTQNSNATAPTVTYANMFWYDTAANQLKKRNEANSAWIVLGTIDEALGTFTPSGERALASQAQAEAGSDNTTVMTPLRTAQAIDALSVFTAQYVSSDQTITSGGLLTLAHGLGEAPKLVQLHLVCAVAQGGWAVGDVIMVGNNQSTSGDNRHTSAYFDATNVYVRFTDSGAAFTVAFKTTGVAVNLTNTSWRLRVRAFA
jgi:hypothetical protein